MIANRRLAQVPGGLASASGARYWEQVLQFGQLGNTVEPLIDGAATFAAMQRAIESAQTRDHYIYLAGWWCDPWVNLTGPGSSLLDLFAAAGRRGVQIRVLLWDPAIIFLNHLRLHNAAVTALNRLPGCHAQLDQAASPRSHHQKLLVVNGRGGLVALAGGVDVNADRRHPLPPPRSAYRADRPANLGWRGASGGGAAARRAAGNRSTTSTRG